MAAARSCLVAGGRRVRHVTGDRGSTKQRPGRAVSRKRAAGQLSSLPSYEEFVRALRSIEASSQGTVEVASAGVSGEGRELLYATVGHGPDVFWLQARIHGNELHSTEAVLQVLRYLGSSGEPRGGADPRALTVIVIPMYNPDGATANIRQSTTPLRIDLNRDWELFQQPESRAFYALWEETAAAACARPAPHGPEPGRGGHERAEHLPDRGALDRPEPDDGGAMADQPPDGADLGRCGGRLGTGNVARYPLIDITNAVISRMLLGGPGPDGSDPGFKTQGAIFYEVRSVGQKSNGMLEQLFVRPTMAVLNAAADGSLYEHSGAGWEDIPFGDGEPCGGGPG